MRATAWSNGSPTSSEAGYGLRISAVDRDRFFDRAWTEIVLDLPDQSSTSIPLSDSFWKRCSELRSAAVGRWLLTAGPRSLGPRRAAHPDAVATR